MFAVPELLAGPEGTGCFLFLPVWFLEALKCIKGNYVRNQPKNSIYILEEFNNAQAIY